MAYKIKKHTIVDKVNINGKPIKERVYYTVDETIFGISVCHLHICHGDFLGGGEVEVSLEAYLSLATSFSYDEACILLREIKENPNRFILINTP